MNCPVCRTENEAGRKFCMECGAPLSLSCTSCGTPNPPASKFCGECGAPLSASAPPPHVAEAPATGAQPTERRLVSVVFLDLVSFTTLSEQRDAEDMRGLLDRYFETTRTVIERHGGVIEKFIGDAVMAVWGTPITREDDAERAVRASLELVDAVAALGAEMGAPLQARAGVLTGEAATAPSAENQGMVAGDMVNTAARLQSAAEPGQVFVGEATFRAASRAISFDEVGDLILKGKEEPVRAWRAVRVVGERQGANRMAIEPPFVGRTEELRLLKELLHATTREGKARVVSVTGIGGIGKSRLAWELSKYVDGLTEDIWWHAGRCPAYGDGITFWALGEMVKMRAGIAETDPPTAARSKLAEAVALHVRDEEERRWLEPRLAFLLGLDERPAGGREEIFAAWRAFFERIADRGTVAMVFEDLQWADTGLLEFVESLLEWSRNRPIFVLTLSRPELADRRPNWGAGQRNFVGIHLEPLPDEAMGELVGRLLPDADDGAVRRIVERAEGIPLYAVETIRMLVDRGVLRAGRDAYELIGDLGELQVPETLHALIASRLDALGPEDRTLLQDAAVLGKSFTLDALAAVTAADPDALEPRLLDLARKEFLVFEADPRSPERGQYGFVQSIIREVAYGMLSKADRRSRHLAVAHRFESEGDEELAGAVASHYVEALRATPPGPDADALAARARDWLGQAAERATSLGSPEQALVFAEQALEITPSGRQRAELLMGARRAASDARQRDRAIAFLREAIDALGAEGDRDGEVVAMGELAEILGNLGQAEELPALVERMERALGDGGDERARAELEHARAWFHYVCEEDIDATLLALERCLPLFEHARAWDRVSQALGEKANTLEWLGRRREAMVLRRGMLAVATEENDLRAKSRALGMLGIQADEYLEAMRLILEAAEVARQGGYGESELGALANAAEFAVEAGAWATADQLLADLGAMPELAIGVSIADSVSISAALLAAYRGDRDSAQAAIDALSEEVTASSIIDMRSWFHRVLSVVRLMEGDLDGAYEQGMIAIRDDPRGLNAPPAAAFASRAALWMGDPAKARSPLEMTRGDREGWYAATRRGIEAGIDALEGRSSEAATTYRAILSERLAKGDPFTHALITLDAMAVLPPDLVPTDDVEAARTYLEELGAGALLARLASSRAAPSPDR